MIDKYPDEFCRVEAASYIDSTPGSLATIDSTKQYDLKPFKKTNGKVYYHRSVLDEFADLDLRP